MAAGPGGGRGAGGAGPAGSAGRDGRVSARGRWPGCPPGLRRAPGRRAKPCPLSPQLYYQVLNFAMIVSSALMIWKGLIVVTGSESPIVVVLRWVEAEALPAVPGLVTALGHRPAPSGNAWGFGHRLRAEVHKRFLLCLCSGAEQKLLAVAI